MKPKGKRSDKLHYDDTVCEVDLSQIQFYFIFIHTQFILMARVLRILPNHLQCPNFYKVK